MDINALYNISSGAIKQAQENTVLGVHSNQTSDDAFGALLNTAIQNVNTTNAYLSDAENEEIRWALGETDSTHDLSIALQKASIALQYTVAIRDKFMDAYKEIMQMQI